jgi:hypothetical protein
VSDFAGKLITVFGRSLTSAVIVLFGYLVWFAFRGTDCSGGMEIACRAGLQLGGVLYGSPPFVSQLASGVCVLGAGYVIALLHFYFFEETLRGNYDSLFATTLVASSADRTLLKRRDHAINKLSADQPLPIEKQDLSDYILYETLGGIFEVNSRNYVDVGRIVGVSALTIIFLLWLDASLYHRLTGSPLWWTGGSTIAIWLVGREFVKAQFRYRAIRIYTNYLLRRAA